MKSFDLRKVSVLREDGTWYHYPQRTGLVALFTKLTYQQETNLTISCKGSILVSKNLETLIDANLRKNTLSKRILTLKHPF